MEEGHRWALLIGVNNYGFATPLKFCVRDMEAYQETLVRHGGYPQENVFLLVDGNERPGPATVSRKHLQHAQEDLRSG